MLREKSENSDKDSTWLTHVWLIARQKELIEYQVKCIELKQY